MNLTDKWASVPYQITSYGLGGLCEDHNDPYGYNEGAALTEERKNLVKSGDIFGTVMGWLSDTTAGGATTFFVNDSPLLLWPTKGAAAFWFGLFSDGTRDSKGIHGGCPVIAGQTETLEVRNFVASWHKDINGKNPSYLGPGVDQSGAGSKWIVNKWIQTFDQFSKFPCSRERRVRVKPWEKSTYW